MSGADFIEIGTDDPAATTAFFKAVMGWEWVDTGTGHGGYFTDGTRKVGMHTEAAACMVPYLEVTDIKDAVDKVISEGGAVMGEIADAPPLGRFATCTDPRGVRFGLHQR